MTTYGVEHILLRAMGVFGGNYASPVEQWSWGLRIFPGTGALTESAKTAFLAAIATAVETFHVASAARVSGSAWLTELTAAYIGTDGLYVGGEAQPTTRHAYVPPKKGTGTSEFPYSQAYAVTLDTSIDRGPGAKGRFYVPVGWAVGSDGRWIPSDVAGMAAAARTMLNSINTAAVAQYSASAGVHVISSTSPYPIGRVTRVAVGRAPDTQRRRDNRLAEEYVWDNLTVARAADEERQSRTYSSGQRT